MTEITRVPLQPIAKGALTKLWLGVAAAVLAAGSLAWATRPASVDVETLKAGTGASPTVEDVVLIKYKGTLQNGKVFDQLNVVTKLLKCPADTVAKSTNNSGEFADIKCKCDDKKGCPKN